MSLLDTVQSDLSHIIENADTFGVPIIFTNPAKTETATVVGQYNDVFERVDLATGTLISGGIPSVSVSIASLESSLSKLPGKNWKVEFTFKGKALEFYVIEPMPDIQLGVIVFTLTRM